MERDIVRDAIVRDAIVRDTIVLSGSRYLILGLGMLRNLFMARLLGADSYAYWVLFLLVLQYADQAHLGLRLAGDCEIPVLRGRGDEAGARRTGNVLLGAILGIAALALLVSAGGGLALMQRGGPIGDYDARLLGVGLVATAVILFTDQLSRFHLMILRTKKRFVFSGAAELSAETLRTSGVIALGWAWGLPGGFIASLLASAAIALFLHIAARGEFRPAWDGRRLRALFTAGFPLFLSNLAGLLIISCDRVVGGVMLRGQDFSLYGFATTLMLLPVFASHGLREVLFPTFGERFGSGGETRALYPMISRSMYAVAFATPPLVAGVLYGGEIVIRLVLPAFVPAIPIMELLSYGIAFMSIASLPVAVLMITRRAWLALGLEGIAVVAAAVCYAGLPPLWGPVVALALGTCVLYGVYGIATLAATLRDCDLRAGEIARETAFIALPAVAGIVLVFLLSRLAPSGADGALRDVGMPALKAGAFGLSYALLLAATRGKTQIFATVRALWRKQA
jgi:O-antigen/teichoic acid export membrane protein